MKKLQFIMALICLIGAFIFFIDSLFLSYEGDSMILGLVSTLMGIIFFLFYLLEIKKKEIEKLRINIRRLNNLQWLLIIPMFVLLQSCEEERVPDEKGIIIERIDTLKIPKHGN